MKCNSNFSHIKGKKVTVCVGVWHKGDRESPDLARFRREAIGVLQGGVEASIINCLGRWHSHPFQDWSGTSGKWFLHGIVNSTISLSSSLLININNLPPYCHYSQKKYIVVLFRTPLIIMHLHTDIKFMSIIEIQHSLAQENLSYQLLYNRQ